MRRGERVLIAAHGNSIRALVKYLDNVSDDEIVGLNIPTGVPLVYELDDDLKPLGHRYLGDEESVRLATEAVAAQGKPGSAQTDHSPPAVADRRGAASHNGRRFLAGGSRLAARPHSSSYSASRTDLKRSVTTLRFTFSVGVTSPSCWPKALRGRMANRLIV